MSPRTQKQFEAIRSEKTNLILQTALRLFAERGFASTTVSLIAKEAGISKGLMYNYFYSKEDLLKTIIIGGLEKFAQFLTIADTDNIKKTELIKFIDENFAILKKDPDFYKLYFSITFQPEVFALLANDFMKIFEDLMAIFIKYYTQKGEVNPYIKTRFILAAFDGIGIHYVMDTQGFPIDGIRDMMIDLL